MTTAELLEALKTAACAEDIVAGIPESDELVGFRAQALHALTGLQNETIRLLSLNIEGDSPESVTRLRVAV